MGTMIAMYEAYRGLREAPFDGAPNPKFLYLSPGAVRNGERVRGLGDPVRVIAERAKG